MPKNEMNTIYYRECLLPLIGKNVTVYQGGPKSKTGKLIDIQSDYLSLSLENQQKILVIYYCLHHVQRISENAKINSLQRRQSTNNDKQGKIVQSPHFHGLLKKLVNGYIKVNQDDLEAKQGKMVDITDDYIILLTEEDGVIFYNTHHIKSIGVQINTEIEENEAEKENKLQETEEDVKMRYGHAQNFHDLFNDLTNTWVSINLGGPEAIEGILVQGTGSCYTLVNNDEVMRLNPYHIKSISYSPKSGFKQSENHSNETIQTEHEQQNGKIKKEDKEDKEDKEEKSEKQKKKISK
jgi:spore coat protein B